MQPGVLPPQALEEIIGQVKGLDMEKVKAEVASQASDDA